MAILGDFAEGFFRTSSETISRRNEIREKEDLQRRQILNELDAKKQLAEFTMQKEEEARVREEQRRREARAEMQDRAMQGLYSYAPQKAPSATDVPSTNGFMTQLRPTITTEGISDNEDPVTMQQYYTNLAAVAAEDGDDNLYKSAKAKADMYKLQIGDSERTRTNERQGYISADGLNPAEELFKSDMSILDKGELDTSLYYKYFGKIESINPRGETEEDVKRTEQLRKAISNAQKLTITLTKLSANENGISDRSSGELKTDAVNLVRLQNVYNQAEDPYEKDSVKELMSEILGNYPTGQSTLLEALLPSPALKKLENFDGKSTEYITINSADAYNELPSGTIFYTPDGVLRQKK